VRKLLFVIATLFLIPLAAPFARANSVTPQQAPAFYNEAVKRGVVPVWHRRWRRWRRWHYWGHRHYWGRPYGYRRYRYWGHRRYYRRYHRYYWR
jgi:hypothetical protein